MKRLFLVVAVMAIVAAGCAADGADEPSAAPPTEPSAELPQDATESLPAAGSDTPIDPGDGIGDGTEGEGLPVVSPDLAYEVDSAMADLATRLPADTLIGVTIAHELTWPDGSLGCPQPDMSYTQALVPGYRIELVADGVVYAYHGATGSDPFLCDEPDGSVPEVSEAGDVGADTADDVDGDIAPPDPDTEVRVPPNQTP